MFVSAFFPLPGGLCASKVAKVEILAVRRGSQLLRWSEIDNEEVEQACCTKGSSGYSALLCLRFESFDVILNL